MSKIGYVRCSSADQNPARQLDLLKEEGCDKVFSDMLSGKNTDRPGLKAMLDYIREGDVVFVESISRLARSTRDLLNIVDEFQTKGVEFISQKEMIDTTTPQGRFMLTVFAAMAELERDQIRQRQAEGIAAAKAQGIRFGAPPKERTDLYETVRTSWQKGVLSAREAARRIGISHTTFLRWVKSDAGIDV